MILVNRAVIIIIIILTAHFIEGVLYGTKRERC